MTYMSCLSKIRSKAIQEALCFGRDQGGLQSGAEELINTISINLQRTISVLLKDKKFSLA